MSDTDAILVPAIIECEITKARLQLNRPTNAQEMEAIAKAVMAIRSSRLRDLYREVLRKELKRKAKHG